MLRHTIVPNRKSKREPGSQLIHRSAVRERVAYADIECQIVLSLPNQSNQARDCPELSEFPLVEGFGDGPHRPFRWPFENGAEKYIAVVLPRQGSGCVQMNGTPLPAL